MEGHTHGKRLPVGFLHRLHTAMDSAIGSHALPWDVCEEEVSKAIEDMSGSVTLVALNDMRVHPDDRVRAPVDGSPGKSHLIRSWKVAVLHAPVQIHQETIHSRAHARQA